MRDFLQNMHHIKTAPDTNSGAVCVCKWTSNIAEQDNQIGVSHKNNVIFLCRLPTKRSAETISVGVGQQTEHFVNLHGLMHTGFTPNDEMFAVVGN